MIIKRTNCEQKYALFLRMVENRQPLEAIQEACTGLKFWIRYAGSRHGGQTWSVISLFGRNGAPDSKFIYYLDVKKIISIESKNQFKISFIDDQMIDAHTHYHISDCIISNPIVICDTADLILPIWVRMRAARVPKCVIKYLLKNHYRTHY